MIPASQIIERLKSLYNPINIAGMRRFGITPAQPLGISVNVLRQIARELPKNHALAQELWASGIHEARILASLVDTPGEVTLEQMEDWVKDFDTWDICDQVVKNLFSFTPYAVAKAQEWSSRPEEFVKRAGFVLMARLAVLARKPSRRKKVIDEAVMASFLPIIAREAVDDRNYVKKSVNWALRQIGKCNPTLRNQAIETARQISRMDSKTARWVAKDALRELNKQEP